MYSMINNLHYVLLAWVLFSSLRTLYNTYTSVYSPQSFIGFIKASPLLLLWISMRFGKSVVISGIILLIISSFIYLSISNDTGVVRESYINLFEVLSIFLSICMISLGAISLIASKSLLTLFPPEILKKLYATVTQTTGDEIKDQIFSIAIIFIIVQIFN
jgi:hypothetical protein